MDDAQQPLNESGTTRAHAREEWPVCLHCRFWVRHLQKDTGECRVKAPVIGMDGGGQWPVTHGTNGCGEGQRRETHLGICRGCAYFDLKWPSIDSGLCKALPPRGEGFPAVDGTCSCTGWAAKPLPPEPVEDYAMPIAEPQPVREVWGDGQCSSCKHWSPDGDGWGICEKTRAGLNPTTAASFACELWERAE